MIIEAASKALDGEHTPATGALLSVQRLRKTFGSLRAIDDLSFDVAGSEIFGIAGPNGAGKSTLLDLCTGMSRPDSGTILFDGRRVHGRFPHRLCSAGIARTFQIPTIFGSLSVRQNVETGAMFGGPPHLQSKRARMRLIDAALEATDLVDRSEQRAGTLGLLARKMTMLAAALATQPRVIFMDEPLGGLTVEEVDRLVVAIRGLHDRFDITFVLVEHKIRALSELSDRLMIMHYGRQLCLDRPEAVLRNEQVVEFYLGSENNA